MSIIAFVNTFVHKMEKNKKHTSYQIKSKIRTFDIVIIFFIILFVGGMIFAYLLKFHNDFSIEHQRWGEFGSYMGAISGSVAAIAVFFNLKQTKNELKKSNAMPILVDLMSELRQERFISIKNEIFKNVDYLLSNEPIPISKLPEELSKAITRYCYTMDNIGLMVKNRLIDQDLIISFYGVEIRFIFYIIEPFLKKEREHLIAGTPDPINKEAHSFYLFHYELLVRLSEDNSIRLIKDFVKLNRELPDLQYKEVYDNIRAKMKKL